MLGGPGLITTRKKCCKGGSASRFGNYPQGLPESQLGAVDRVVGNQDYVVHVPLGDGVHERADATGRKQIRRDPTSRCINRLSSPERHREGGGAYWFNFNHPNPTGKPSRNAGDKPTATDTDEERIDIPALFLDLQPDGSLAQQCFALVVGVDR